MEARADLILIYLFFSYYDAAQREQLQNRRKYIYRINKVSTAKNFVLNFVSRNFITQNHVTREYRS